MKCIRCGCNFVQEDLGLPTSIHPADRHCYECYCEIMDEGPRKPPTKLGKLKLYAVVLWATLVFKARRFFNEKVRGRED